MKKYPNKGLFTIVIILLITNFVLGLFLIIRFLGSVSQEKHHYDINRILQETELVKYNLKIDLKKIGYQISKELTPYIKTEIIKELEKKQIKYYEIQVNPLELGDLFNYLPASGREYIDGTIVRDNGNINCELKVRGDVNYHWGFDKKSYAIKCGDGVKINLVNPKSPDMISDQLSSDIAKEFFNVPSPSMSSVGLFINNKFEGIYIDVEDINDMSTIQNYEYIIEGENLARTKSSGYPLFIDYTKWGTVSGKTNLYSFSSFLKAIYSKNHKDFFEKVNFSEWVNFYSLVSYIQNFHYDSSHNWKIGFGGNYSPIVWDPIGWYQSDKAGNGVEEVISPISRLLRKNTYFNQAFSENLWEKIQDKELINYINQNIDKQKTDFAQIINYDYLKGSAFKNPVSMRFPQSTESVISSMTKLKETINTRIKVLNESLSNVEVRYFLDGQNLYIHYNGIAGSNLLDYTDQIEVFNNDKYIIYPEYFQKLIVGGRTVSTLGTEPYAYNCSMTYKMKVGSDFDISQIKLVHSLTNEEVLLVKADELEVTDCQMNFDIPQEESQVIKNSNINNLPILDLSTENVHIAEFFDFNNRVGKTIEDGTKNGAKIGENVQIRINNQEIKGEVKKSKYDDILRLKLEALYQGRDKWILLEKNEKNQRYVQTMSIAKKLGIATPIYNEIYLKANNFDIGEYYLVENIDKGFIENNKMTFDTDIFDKDEIDTLDKDNWDKLAFDPHEDEDNTKLLEGFLKDVEDVKNLDQWIDIESFVDFYNFLALTGNENLDYLLYFDNTQGRFKFVPYYYTLYKNTNFEVKDPVIKNVVKYLEEKSYITYATKPEFTEIVGLQSNVSYDRFAFVNDKKMQELVFPEDYELGVFREKLNDNKITLEENSHYEINYDLLIPSNIDLIINSGVNLKIAEGKSIITYGQVFAIGKKENPIIIKSKSDKNYGVFAVVGNKADGSQFEYVNFENGSETFFRNTYLSAEFTVYHTEAKISHCYVKGSSSDDGLNIKFAKADLSYTTFDSNSGDAFDGDFVTGDVYNNYFINNGNDGADVSGSEVHIYNNHIQNYGDKCISVGENSSPLLTNNFLDGCHTGMEIKDHSTVEAQHNVFIYNDTAINAYQKKDFFSGGYGKISNSIFYNNERNLTYDNVFTGEKLLSDDSNIVIVNSLIDKLNRDENILQNYNKIGTETLQSIKDSNWIIDNIGLTESGFIYE